jgi:hypothetical protein
LCYSKVSCWNDKKVSFLKNLFNFLFVLRLERSSADVQIYDKIEFFDPHFLSLFWTFWTSYNTIQKKKYSCPSVWISVFAFRFSVTNVTHHRNVVQTLFWCQNAENFNARNWLDFGLKGQWLSWNFRKFCMMKEQTEIFSTKYYACCCDASNEVRHAYVWRHMERHRCKIWWF